eukprot:CAMPEP_0172377448 /NCGR_PEP_ID=MMETSP1060-20121228/68904_1 /TAXON_ID=37318 /ORGANISM="Pseudo-nitzschia pungens, Strain cf. cingulata" /LENGTH=192 /DNA_ID=CAMNT_0013105133 /DNA_START=1382 /DNA_END=1957 /DNA_ORIENTATION=+
MPPATEANVYDDNTVHAPTSPRGRPATEPSPSQTRNTTGNLSTHFDQYCARALRALFDVSDTESLLCNALIVSGLTTWRKFIRLTEPVVHTLQYNDTRHNYFDLPPFTYIQLLQFVEFREHLHDLQQPYRDVNLYTAANFDAFLDGIPFPIISPSPAPPTPPEPIMSPLTPSLPVTQPLAPSAQASSIPTSP